KKAGKIVSVFLAIITLAVCAFFMTGPVAAKFTVPESFVQTSSPYNDPYEVQPLPVITFDSESSPDSKAQTPESEEADTNYEQEIAYEEEADSEARTDESILNIETDVIASSVKAEKAETSKQGGSEATAQNTPDDENTVPAETEEAVPEELKDPMDQANVQFASGETRYDLATVYKDGENGVTSVCNSYIKIANDIAEDYVFSVSGGYCIVVKSYEEYLTHKKALTSYSYSKYSGRTLSDGTRVNSFYYAVPEYDRNYFDNNILLIVYDHLPFDKADLELIGTDLKITCYDEWHPGETRTCDVKNYLNFIGLDRTRYAAADSVSIDWKMVILES
ncbi:MAG: hypothetical protein IKN38_03395, partial [Clostridia bacterium]|nr:hypothetical protein [Clostridia bacterium]